MNPTYLGIDFGTTKTLVSRFNERKNEPQTVRLGRGHDFVPTSVLAGGNDSFIFGDEADDQFAYNPSSYARAFKLKLGGSTYVLSYRDEKTRKRCTAAYLTQKYLEYILRECKDNSYACDRAVLTRPVKFTPDQLAQLEEAAHAAGLREVEFITEPQAAAYAYCNERPAEAWQNALVVDWGGGTLDMALVSKTAKGVVVHEKYCDGMLRGGEDFDDALFLLAETAIKRGEDAPMWKALEKDKLDLGWTLTTRVRIRQAKEDLSRSKTKPLPLRSCEGRAYKPVQLKKEDFEKSIMPDLAQAAKMAKKLIDSIQEKSLKPSVILLVGGSCKIPAVADALQKATGIDKKHIKTWDQADEAVSLGAALYAHKLWGTQTDSPAPQREATPPPVTPDNSSDNVFIGVKPSSIFSRPGSDLRYDLDITLDEAMSGCDKVLEIERLVPCNACAARGSKDSTKGYKICSTCHGSGVITQQSGFSVQQSTCPSCSGLGQIISNPCSKCHGEGRVHKFDEAEEAVSLGAALWAHNLWGCPETSPTQETSPEIPPQPSEPPQPTPVPLPVFPPPQPEPIPIPQSSQKSAPVPSPNLASQPKPAPKTQPSSSKDNSGRYMYIIGYLVLVGLMFYALIEGGDLHWGIALILAFLLGGIMLIWIRTHPIPLIIFIIYKVIKGLWFD